MNPEPTASNLFCAVCTLLTLIPAIASHSIRYSESSLATLAGRFVGESQVSTLVGKMRHYFFSPGTVALDWAAYASLPVSMWIGVRLMDCGYLRSLWPWAIVPGGTLLGVLIAHSENLRSQRMKLIADESALNRTE